MEVVGAQVSRLNSSSILSLLHPWVNYFASLPWVPSLWSGTQSTEPTAVLPLWIIKSTNSHFQMHCVLRPDCWQPDPKSVPSIFGPLWEGLMMQPRFLRNSFAVSLGWPKGGEILMSFSHLSCCLCSDSRRLTFLAWN